MTDEEKVLEGLKKSIQDEVKQTKSEMEKGLLNKEDFETRMASINEKFDALKTDMVEKEAFDNLQSQIDKLNEKHEALKLTGKQAETFIDQIIGKAVGMMKDYQEKGRAVEDFVMTTKSGALTMGITTTTGDGVVAADREPGINYEPKRNPVMLSIIRTGTTVSNTVEWIEKTDETGEPAFKKELEDYPKRSWKTTLKQLPVKKLGVFSEYTREELEDVDGFQAELRRDLVEKLQLLLDQNILDGTGGASDDDLKGVLQYAQAWDNGTFEVAKPNIYDVIAVGADQIIEEHHVPTHAVMRNKTALAMNLTKDDNGNYIMPPFSTANGMTVSGLRVITTTNPGIAANGILLMDAAKAEFKFKRNWTLEMSDSHKENFTKDVTTVKLSGRGVLKIKNTDAKAFVYITDYATGITALTPGS